MNSIQPHALITIVLRVLLLLQRDGVESQRSNGHQKIKLVDVILADAFFPKKLPAGIWLHMPGHWLASKLSVHDMGPLHGQQPGPAFLTRLAYDERICAANGQRSGIANGHNIWSYERSFAAIVKLQRWWQRFSWRNVIRKSWITNWRRKRMGNEGWRFCRCCWGSLRSRQILVDEAAHGSRHPM